MARAALRQDLEMLFPEAIDFDGLQLQQVPSVAAGSPVRTPAQRAASGGTIASIALFAGDASTFIIAAILLLPFGSFAGQMPVVLALVAAATLLLHWSDALYPGYGIYPHEILRRRVVAAGKVALLATVGALLLTGGWRMPALILSLLAIFLVLQPVVRALLRTVLARHGLWGRPVAVVGKAKDVDALREYLVTNWQIGMQCNASSAWPPDTVNKTALICNLQGESSELDLVRERFAEVVAIAGIPGTQTPGLRPADLHGEIGLRLHATSRAKPGGAGRALDLAAAGLALMAVAPVLVLASAAIYAADPGPVIYRQTREGLGGRPFRMLKLRTMYRDADQRLETLLNEDEAARAEWTTHYKLRSDPRVLPLVGVFLRASSIDELPQLLNVIRGDMRMVGPRPFPIYHVAAMDADFRAKRCTVTPGVTGLWQISGRSNADIARQQELDGFYIDNRSFWFDFHILLGTFAAVFRGDGAH